MCKLTHLHGEVDAHVDVLCPDVVGGLVVEDGEDAAVQVALAGGLLVTRHGHDGGAWAVPGQQVGRPATTQRWGDGGWGGLNPVGECVCVCKKSVS